ncbi:MAG: hypothetical protein ABJA32_02675 [Ginsengibacter sp.]|jgi:hypothetical protein
MTSFIVLSILLVGLLYFGSVPFAVATSRKKTVKLLRHLSNEGAANNLVFCSQEVFQNRVIGIDGIHRKIMLIEKSDRNYQSSIISLDEVNDCQLITNHDSQQERGRQNVGGEIDSPTVEIRFDFNNHSKPAFIKFGDGLIDSRKELDFLRAKAEYWCIMFSKMLHVHGIEARA